MTDQPATKPETCPKCQRPFATVDDFRNSTIGGKCPTGYATRDPDAANDCEEYSRLSPYQKAMVDYGNEELYSLRQQLAAVEGKFHDNWLFFLPFDVNKATPAECVQVMIARMKKDDASLTTCHSSLAITAATAELPTEADFDRLRKQHDFQVAELVACKDELTAKCERLEGELGRLYQANQELIGEKQELSDCFDAACDGDTTELRDKLAAAESQLAALQSQLTANRIDASRLAELERGWKKIAEYIGCLPQEDVQQLVFYALESKGQLAAKGEAELPLPDSEGWWWEDCCIPGVVPKDKPWVARDCEIRDGAMCWWGDGEWVPCREGRWVKCIPPGSSPSPSRPSGEEGNLRTVLQKTCDEHIAIASEYERGGNDRGAAQLRAVANLIGVILQGGEPVTVLPPAAEARRIVEGGK